MSGHFSESLKALRADLEQEQEQKQKQEQKQEREVKNYGTSRNGYKND